MPLECLSTASRAPPERLTSELRLVIMQELYVTYVDVIGVEYTLWNTMES